MQRVPFQQLPGKQANLFASSSPADDNKPVQLRCLVYPCPVIVFTFLEILHLNFTPGFREI
jgi:hypothetical protein